MAIEYKNLVYRNLQEQVLKNKEDIEALEEVEANDVEELRDEVSSLNQEIARTLKTPIDAPVREEVVTIKPNNAQGSLALERFLKTPSTDPTKILIAGIYTNGDQLNFAFGKGLNKTLSHIDGIYYLDVGENGKYCHHLKVSFPDYPDQIFYFTFVNDVATPVTDNAEFETQYFAEAYSASSEYISASGLYSILGQASQNSWSYNSGDGWTYDYDATIAVTATYTDVVSPV